MRSVLKTLRVLTAVAVISAIIGTITEVPSLRASQRFSDITGHWAESFLQTMAEAGLINGYEDGTFKPDRTISREEFITILARAKHLVPSWQNQSASFRDVDSKRWSYPYIQAAVQAGILRPAEYDHKLDPVRPISRSEIARLLVRAAGLESETSKGGCLITFADLKATSDVAYTTVALNHGLLAGYPDGSFRPTASTTRAEACTAFMRLSQPDLRPTAWAEQYQYASQGNIASLSIVRANLNRPEMDLKALPAALGKTPGLAVAAITPGSSAASTVVPGPVWPSSTSNPLWDRVTGALSEFSGLTAILSGGQITTLADTPRLTRVAVGITADGFAVLARSDNATRRELATMLRDLACTDAMEIWSVAIPPAGYSPGLYMNGAALTTSSDGAADKALTVVAKTPIAGKPQVTAQQAQRWAISRNATPTFVSLAPLYWDYCQKAGIRPEIAFCQAAKETNFGHFTGVVPEAFHNPCGLKTASGGSNDDPEAHQRFPDWATGVRAHVDHLALYAGVPGYPCIGTPDPRHFPKLYGVARYLEDLGGPGKWAPSPDYGYSIRLKSLKELLETP